MPQQPPTVDAGATQEAAYDAADAGANRGETARERFQREDEQFERERLSNLSLRELAERNAALRRQVTDSEARLGPIQSKLKGERPMRSNEDRAMLELGNILQRRNAPLRFFYLANAASRLPIVG